METPAPDRTKKYRRVRCFLLGTCAFAALSLGSAHAQAPGLYYIHVDHLNTPRAIYDQQQQLVWRWDQQEPFGNSPPDENPSGLGTFECNLRFPGQYFDKETNLAYNYFRDFDPALGRFVQSDPIGLEGSINTYAYVGSNPLSDVDPSGLLRINTKTCGPKAVAATKKAEAQIRSYISTKCGQCADPGLSCLDCDLGNRVLTQLNASRVTCTAGKYCSTGDVGGSGITMMPAGLNPSSTCGCIANTLLHEVLHNVGFSHKDAGDPITAIDASCAGKLCPK